MHRRLIVMRHAKSAWSVDVPDFERPLAPRGRRDVAAAALALRPYAPQAILSSSAVRAQQTIDALHEAGLIIPADVTSAFYSENLAEMINILRTWAAPLHSALVIGHYPTVLDLLASAATPDGGVLWTRVTERFPTSAFAVAEWEGNWATLGDGRAQLTRFEIPRG